VLVLEHVHADHGLVRSGGERQQDERPPVVDADLQGAAAAAEPRRIEIRERSDSE
jgi:hypothetical protein